MFKDKLNKLLGKNDDGTNNKKRIENLVFFIILLIITIVAINLIWNGNKDETNEQTNNTSKQLATTNNINQTNQIQTLEETNLEIKLEEILSKIQGVGEVNVMITYSQTSQTVPLYNEDTTTKDTEETDESGGTRKITESDSKKDIIFKENDGEKEPITQSIISPKIEGAIIAAKGAANAEVKSKIVQAVEAVTGLATHKIQVFEMQE